jgi:magnesium transporter
MLRLYRFDPVHNRGTWLPAEAMSANLDELRSCSDILWVDLENPSDEEEELVFKQFFPIHFLSLEDVMHLKRKPGVPPHFPKVEEFPDYLFVIVNPLANRLLETLTREIDPENGTLFEYGSPVTQLSAVLTHRILITHHKEEVNGVGKLLGYLDKHSTAAGRGPDYLFHLILDEMVDEYAPVLDHFGEVLENHEARIFRKPSQRLLSRLIHCKRSITILRKTLIYEREILARLSRGEFDLINEREAVYYRNVYDHLIRFAELIESTRELVNDLLQMHLAAASNRMNEVMKVLTMISTTVLPMTLVAGIYGMNFTRLAPDTENPYGFEISLGMMLLAGLTSFLFFRWRKWI